MTFGLTTGPNYEGPLDVNELAGRRQTIPLPGSLCFRGAGWRTTSLTPARLPTDDSVHNSGCSSHSRKKCGARQSRVVYRNYGELISGTVEAISTAVFPTALGACPSQVTVHDPSIPNPLVDKIPISIAVRIPTDDDANTCRGY